MEVQPLLPRIFTMPPSSTAHSRRLLVKSVSPGVVTPYDIELAALRRDYALLQREWAALRRDALLRRYAGQPRLPAGDGGGQFTFGKLPGGIKPSDLIRPKPGTDGLPQDIPHERVQEAAAPLVGIARAAIAAYRLYQSYQAYKATKQLIDSYNISSDLNNNNQRSVLEFRANDYGVIDPEASTAKAVRVLNREEASQFCPRLEEVQRYTDEAVTKVSAERDYPNASVFGTYVHTEVRDRVKAVGDLDFIAERSFLKENGEKADYGVKNTVRIDVLEKTSQNTVCVYDIKTGNARFTIGRMNEVALTVAKKYGAGMNLIVTEIKPSK